MGIKLSISEAYPAKRLAVSFLSICFSLFIFSIGSIVFSNVASAYISVYLEGPPHMNVGSDSEVRVMVRTDENTKLCGSYQGIALSGPIVAPITQDYFGSNYHSCFILGLAYIKAGDPAPAEIFYASKSEPRMPAKSAGTYIIAKLNVKATSTGTARVSLSGGSLYNYDSALATPSSSISFPVYPATCPSGQSGTPPNCYTPAPPPPTPPAPPPAPATPPPSSPSSPATPTAPSRVPATVSPAVPSPTISAPPAPASPSVVKEDETRSIAFVLVTEYIRSATLRWTTSSNLNDVKVTYNKSGSSSVLLDASKIKKVGNDYVAYIDGLDSFTSYDFTVSGINESNHPVSYRGIMTTRGYPSVIQLLRGSNPVKEATVTFFGYDYVTDADGKIYIELPSGKVPFNVTTDEGTMALSVNVEDVLIDSDNAATKTQSFTIDISRASVREISALWLLLLIPPIVAIIILIIIKKRHNNKSQPAYEWSPLTGLYDIGVTNRSQNSQTSMTNIPTPMTPVAPSHAAILDSRVNSVQRSGSPFTDDFLNEVNDLAAGSGGQVVNKESLSTETSLAEEAVKLELPQGDTASDDGLIEAQYDAEVDLSDEESGELRLR